MTADAFDHAMRLSLVRHDEGTTHLLEPLDWKPTEQDNLVKEHVSSDGLDSEIEVAFDVSGFSNVVHTDIAERIDLVLEDTEAVVVVLGINRTMAGCNQQSEAECDTTDVRQ